MVARTWLLNVSVLAVLLGAATSHGDVAATDSGASSSAPAPTGTGVAAAAEPITDTPATTAPGSATRPKDPFAPYAIGPGINDTSPKPTWSYADLNAAEKAVADTGRDTTKWNAVHNAYAVATSEIAHRAASSSAASQIGVDNLAGLGVVP